MIDIINYGETSLDRKVVIRKAEEGQSFAKVTLLDVTKAIEYRLKNKPSRNSHGYNSTCESTVFLVKLAYELDILEQYLEIAGKHWERKFILNFTKKNYKSIYSISFEGDLNSALMNYNHQSFSELTKAPLITIEELREKYLPLYFFSIENGRSFLGNTVYYDGNETQFCLPIRELVIEAEKIGLIEKYIKTINAKYDNDNQRLNVKIVCMDAGVGNNKNEFTYTGYVDLEKFSIVIETEERCKCN